MTTLPRLRAAATDPDGDVRTRIAPTPSGYLHEGNAVNFLLVSWLARAQGGVVVLRIDDVDRDRYRREYVDDIFGVLEWLDIAVDEGPSSTSEFEQSYSQQSHDAVYRSALATLIASPIIETFACACSRQDVASGKPCECRSRGVQLAPNESALRVRVPADHGELLTSMGDFVVWRRDDRAAYQLASVVEDESLAITHIVRGDDLRPSTLAQRFIAPALGADHFVNAVVLHHPLVTDPSGAKLSKSQARGGPMVRTPALRARIIDSAHRIGAGLGISPPA